MTLMTGMEVSNLWDRVIKLSKLRYHLNKSQKEGKILHIHATPLWHIVKTFQRAHKVIFLMRDPRDQLISMLYYIKEKNWEYYELSNHTIFATLSMDEQIDEMITGRLFGHSVPNEIIKHRMPWMSLPEDFVYTAHFENLVGKKGGGSEEAQRNEILNIANFLNIQLTEEKLEEILEKSYGKPGERTFRSGQIGSWKHYFNELHKNNFKLIFGKELIELGYESDNSW
jgi:hypothetical protein